MLLVLLAPLAMFAIGCSTSATFRLPPDTTLKVTDRTVTPDANGEWKTSPFFWDQTGGADYHLYDKNGNVIRRGKVKTKFRVVSIFWPPAAIIYWPMGLVKDQQYDFTKPGDGYIVRDDSTPLASPAAAPVPVATPAPAATKAVPAKPKKK